LRCAYSAGSKVSTLTVNQRRGNQCLVAYVVLADEQTLPISELRNFLNEKLPAYMIPSAFVMLEKLPLTASGKVDRQALPAPDATRPQLERVFVAPRNALEEKLARIWAEVLGLERVGVEDTFFELGGHSLLATQWLFQLRDALQMHFVSTLSVLAHDGVANTGVILEQDDLDLSKGIAGGYAQSKWVAEKLVTLARSRGLPVSIYRPGRITGHSQTGICNANDLMGKMIKISFQLGSVPEMDTMVDLTPVDYVSKGHSLFIEAKKVAWKSLPLVQPSTATLG